MAYFTPDAKLADHALGGEFQALCFRGRERCLRLERGENFVARHGRGAGEGQDGTTARGLAKVQLVRGSDHDLEPNFFLAGLQFTHDSYG